MIDCLKCGKCCYVIANGVKKRCKFLRNTSDGLTECLKYYSRIGTHIAVDKKLGVIKCGDRKDSPVDFEGCPYNSGKMLFEEALKQGGYKNKGVNERA